MSDWWKIRSCTLVGERMDVADKVWLGGSPWGGKDVAALKRTDRSVSDFISLSRLAQLSL